MKIGTETHYRITPALWRACLGYDLMIWEKNNETGSLSVVTNMTLEKCDGEYVSKPTATLTSAEAQELADTLWEAGIRPTQSKSSAGQHEAQEKHLNDMRSIVASSLKIKLP